MKEISALTDKLYFPLVRCRLGMVFSSILKDRSALPDRRHAMGRWQAGECIPIEWLTMLWSISLIEVVSLSALILSFPDWSKDFCLFDSQRSRVEGITSHSAGKGMIDDGK